MEDNNEIMEQSNNISAAQKICVIPDGVHIQGNVIARSDLELTGEIEGDVEVSGYLTFDGTIRGKYVKADYIDMVSGVIYGDVECTEEIKIGSNAVIIGDVKTKYAKVYGAIKGHILAEEDLQICKSAVISGTIDATNVNIELGATCNISMHDSNSDELSFKIFKELTEN